MNSENQHTGSCLCGAVRIYARINSSDIGACHCAMCRKWGGGPLLAAECDGQVRLENSENISVYDSSEWAERGFCKTCGTHLFYRLKEEAHYAVPVGLFDGNEEWNLTEQIFIDEKPAFYAFIQDTKDLTGEQVFAKYADK